jgi:16S rRNA (uracil1498-N3)-methyltransferase
VSRFHVRVDSVSGEHVTFDADEAHHLARVLRLSAGDLVQALDGRGHELTVRLTRVAPRAAEGTVVSRVERHTESPLSLVLAQGIPRGDKLEAIIRMATELGVSRIAPLVTERTVVRVEPAQWEHRLARCRRVAREAAKQSGRSVVPEVEPPRTLDAWLLEARPPGLLLCLWEGESTALATALPAAPLDRITAIIGPEGGLSDAEVARIADAGGVVAGLGPRILRTDTAAPIVLALLQARYGDLGGSR